MNDLFAFGSATQPLDAEERYGTTGDMKKTQYVMQLLGSPGDADTLKCLITAAEKGIEIESAVIDITENAQDSEDYRVLSPFGIVPVLKEAKYICAGEPGMSVFIEGRGLGNRLAPRNAAVYAEQNYWMDVGNTEVAPHVKTLMQELVHGPMSDPSYQADAAAIEAARNALISPLNAIDRQLTGKAFIVGDYSYADAHWTAYTHLLNIAGESALIDQHRNLKSWYDRIKTHRSFSGQDVVAYDLLPTLDDIKTKKLNDVVCGEF